MEPNIIQPHSRAKDIFLNLVSMITLYSFVAALMNLLFEVINKAFPQISSYSSYSYYNYGTSSISFPVATLIIVFPLYILFMWLIERDLATTPDARTSGIRKWLIYITLFISGGFIIGDLVAVVYYFIDGQELTAGFLLKVLSIFVVAGIVFWYYITDIRNKLSPSLRKASAVVALICVIAAIIVGFMVIGGPRVQRLAKHDQAKFSAVQSLAYNIRNFYDRSGILPTDLAELAQSNSYGSVKYTDTQTNKPYVYNIIDDTTFEVCAEFNLDSDRTDAFGKTPQLTTYGDGEEYENNVWGGYKAGKYCFRQIVVPPRVQIDAQIPVY